MMSTRDRRASLPDQVREHETGSFRCARKLTPRSETSAAVPTPPRAAVQSAPATHPATRYRSTPVKRKACSIPLALLPIHDSFSRKRRRLTSQVLPLLQGELHGRWYTHRNFLADFIHHGPWALSDAQAIHFLALLSQDSPTKGITYDPINDNYCCTPPGFSDRVFSSWFCDLGIAILRVSNLDPGVDNNSTVTSALGHADATLDHTAQCPNEHIPESPPTPSYSSPGGLSWVSCRTSTLQGLGNPQIRPDFVLTSNSIAPTWSTILVVGEHQSAGKTEETAKLQLASYVEQVFIAQPFRMATIGILTSNTSSFRTLWRFDRAGAVGSLKLNYSSTSGGLTSVIQCLYSLTKRQLQATWFHTRSVSWVGPKKPDWCTLEPTNEDNQTTNGERAAEEVLLNKRIFAAGGIVSRGTCVWEGTLKATGTVVAVKYSWQSTERTSEAKIYSVAHSKGVVGLPGLVSDAAYDDVHTIVGRGVIPCILRDPDPGCNRLLTRLVLETIGKPIADSSLSPLEIARSLLAGVIAHASLFFQGGILHRDVSINNIMAITSPLATVPKTPPTIGGEFLYTPGTDLYGCLIDLDYAVVISEQDTSGIPERTGTYPFIAIAILQGAATGLATTHRYRHDLESFLYVLLWVACYPVASTQSAIQGAPSGEARQGDIWPAEDPLDAWGSQSEATVANLKSLNIVSYKYIFEKLLERFRPGFDRFKSAARDMRLALWELYDTGRCIVELEELEGAGTEEGTAMVGQRRGRKQPRTLGAGDVRIGVSNWEGFCDVRGILEELVHWLESEAIGTRG